MAGADLAPARALVYRDVPIRDRGEMLSLTDMWRAAVNRRAAGRQTGAGKRVLTSLTLFRALCPVGTVR